ncbi:uncharacterized protein METZ01_LOCUS165144 [marine metagenome]|uniref:Uncharacterized protein n=1 Tax=marine metagenome TaxID=408172 RepID=A0A382BEJ8_9ZZZZ
MKSIILIEGVSCNVLYLFYDEKIMRTGLGRKNWRGGLLHQPAIKAKTPLLYGVSPLNWRKRVGIEPTSQFNLEQRL